MQTKLNIKILALLSLFLISAVCCSVSGEYEKIKNSKSIYFSGDSLYQISNENTKLAIPISADNLISRPKTLQVNIKEIINPNRAGFYVNVYLRSEKEGKIRLGNFSPYPPDEEAKYLFRIDKKLKNLFENAEQDSKLELIFSLNYFKNSDKSNKLIVKIDSLIWK